MFAFMQAIRLVPSKTDVLHISLLKINPYNIQVISGEIHIYRMICPKMNDGVRINFLIWYIWCGDGIMSAGSQAHALAVWREIN